MNVITSRDNDRVREYLALRDRKKERRAQNAYVCEGEKIFGEALREGAEIRRVFATEGCIARRAEELARAEAAGAEILRVSDSVLSLLSDVETPQGVAFSVAIPRQEEPSELADLLVCDEIRDPGNLGTMIRTADAFGAGGIYLCGDCADAFSPKVVRSCMGSIFRLPILSGTAEELAGLCARKGLSLWAAKPRGDAVPLSAGLPARSAVVIGNEAHGVRPEIEAVCRGALYVDMSGRAESLNAAVCASVVLWHMQSARPGKEG